MNTGKPADGYASRKYRIARSGAPGDDVSKQLYAGGAEGQAEPNPHLWLSVERPPRSPGLQDSDPKEEQPEGLGCPTEDRNVARDPGWALMLDQPTEEVDGDGEQAASEDLGRLPHREIRILRFKTCLTPVSPEQAVGHDGQGKHPQRREPGTRLEARPRDRPAI